MEKNILTPENKLFSSKEEKKNLQGYTPCLDSQSLKRRRFPVLSNYTVFPDKR